MSIFSGQFHFAEFLSYAEVWYGFGPFQVILGASSRELAVVDGPGKADEDVSHNNLSIVRAGDRFFVLALRPKGDAALTDHAGHFAFAITSVDALPDIPPWRARTLLGVSVSTRVVVDVNGDGRDEVVANYTGVSNDNEQVCLFEVVESP